MLSLIRTLRACERVCKHRARDARGQAHTHLLDRGLRNSLGESGNENDRAFEGRELDNHRPHNHCKCDDCR